MNHCLNDVAHILFSLGQIPKSIGAKTAMSGAAYTGHSRYSKSLRIFDICQVIGLEPGAARGIFLRHVLGEPASIWLTWRKIFSTIT